MLENLDLSKRLKGREWRALRLPLQRRLYDLQRALFLAGIPAVILVEGWAGAGKGPAIRTLTERLDPRAFRVWTVHGVTGEERGRPWLWRYWAHMPARNEIAIFDGAWYGQVLQDRIERRLREEAARAAYRDCLDLEQMLAEDGHVIVKFWLHFSRGEQRRRLRESDGEALRWPGSRAEGWKQHRKYDEYLPLVEEMLELTDTKGSRWTIVEAQNPAYAQWRMLTATAEAFGDTLRKRGLPAPEFADTAEEPE